MAEHQIIGQEGEKVAMEYLMRKGYALAGHNVRFGHDEIDIIAYDPVDSVMAFIEVKSRKKNDPDFQPELNLTRDKKQCLLRSARQWVAEAKFEGGYRIDLITVAEGSVIDHIKQVNCEESLNAT